MKLQNTSPALFSTLAFALAVTLQAQNRSLPLLRNSDIQNFTDIQPSLNDAPETVVWSESFANGIPTGWSTSGTANGSANTNAVWVYRGPNTTPSNATGSRGAYAAGQLPILSPTASNGFVIFDSDYLDNNGIAGNFCGTGALACAPHYSTLTTSTINLQQHSNVELRFYQYYRRFAGPGGVQSLPATYIDISTNGGVTWSNTTTLNSTVAVNALTARNSLVSINISQFAGNQSNVKLRFRFDGDYYFWQIDDLEIVSVPKFRLTKEPIVATNKVDGKSSAFKFSNSNECNGVVNHRQVSPMIFDGSVKNTGTNVLPNLKLQVKVFRNNQIDTILYSSNQSTLASNSTASFNINSGYSPTDTGIYALQYTVISDSASTKLDSLWFQLTKNQIGSHFGVVSNLIGSGTNTTQWGTGSGVRQVFNLSTDTLIGLKIGIGSATLPASLVVSINQSNSVTYNLSQTDLTNGFAYIPFSTHIPVSGNTEVQIMMNGIIMLKNDATVSMESGRRQMYLAALANWYTGFSNSDNFNRIQFNLITKSNFLPNTPYPQGVSASGLVGWWPFKGNANDESGNGNNGTPSGAILTTDRYGIANNAYNFDGVDDRISIPHSATINCSTVSIVAWVKPNTYLNFDGNQSQVVSKREWSGWGNSYEFGIGKDPMNNYNNTAENAAYVNYSVSGNATKSFATNLLSTSNWSMITYTHDNVSVKLYLNDSLMASYPSPGLLPTGNTLPVWFGARPGNNGRNFFNGKIDDVGIWNRALTLQEIQSLYYSSICISDIPTVTTETACGPESVTLNATWANTANHQHIWLSPTGRVVGQGANYTTPVITAATTQKSQLIVKDNSGAQVAGGPVLTATTPTGGYGNFTNGTWITVNQAMILDTVSVKLNSGTVNFRIRVYEKAGSKSGNTGNLIMASQPMSVSSSSSGTLHRVYVNLPILPGSYYINLEFLSGTTGTLFRSTSLPTGQTYPFALGSLATIDSVQFGATGSNTRVYYLFNWSAYKICTGPTVTTNIPFTPLPSRNLPHLTNFNNNIPCNWENNSVGANWVNKNNYTGNGYSSTSINGSSFLMIDDNLAGSSASTINSSLTTSEFSALGYDTITLRYKSVFKANGGRGYIDVWRPVNGVYSWVVLDSLTSDQGIGSISTGWQATTKSYNLTSFQSNSLKIRFRYNDMGVVAGWWAIDDFELFGTKSQTGNVRVAITTDIYGSEVSWKIVNTANKLVYAAGGPFPDVSPYVAATATHIDTVALPLFGQYEFRITDAYGDGLNDGTYNGTYLAQVLCPSSFKIIDQGSGALPYDPGGSMGNIPSYDSAIFDMGCSAISPPTTTPNIVYCQGAVALQLSATPLPGATLKWFDGQFNPLTQAPVPSTANTGVFTFYVGQLTSNGISALIPIVVTINALPVVNAGADVTVCAGTPVTLSGSGATTYTWNNGVSNGVAFTPTATTTYTVTGTDANGCVNTDQVVVTVNPVPLPPTVSNVSYCQNTPAVQLTATPSLNGVLNWGVPISLPVGVSFSILSPFGIQGAINHTNNSSASGWGLANLSSTSIVDTVVVMDDSTSGVNTVLGTNPVTGSSYPGIPLKYEGCNLDTNSIWQTSRLAGKIVLIARGTCEYGLKVKLAQAAGARAVILFNRDNALLNPGPGAYGGSTNLPFVFVSRNAGDSLLNVILSGQTVVAFIGNGTGGMYGGYSNVSPIPSTSQVGVSSYYVNQINSFGCRSLNDTILVTVNALPLVNAGADVTVCAGTPVTLSGSGAATYTWNNGVSNGVAFTPTATTTYSVTGTDANGCVNSDSTLITVNAMPDTSVVVTGALSFCPGSSVSLSAASGLDYQWSTGDTTQSVVLSQSGTAYAVVTTVNGCVDTTASFTALLYPGADTTITASKLTFCASDSSVIAAAGGQSYLWNTGDTTQSITVNQTGNFAVTVTTVNGCVGVTDTVSTTVVPDVVLPQILGDLYGWFASGDTVNFSVVNTGGYTLTWGVAGGQITGGQGGDTVQVVWGAADSSAAVWVVVSNGVCQDSAYLNLVISGLGTGEGVGARAMAFPNPNTGVFTLEWSNLSAQEVVLYNGVGQAVAKQAVSAGSSSIQLDLRGNAAGIYRAVIYGKDGQVTLPVYVRY